MYLELSVNSGVKYLIMEWSQFQTTLMMQALFILVITLNVTCSSIYSSMECLRSINIFSYFSLFFLTCFERFLNTNDFFPHTILLMEVCRKLTFFLICEEN